MASVDIPAYGYGIRYQHGLFRQEIDRWLAGRNCRKTGWRTAIRGSSSGARATYEIGFGGTVETSGPMTARAALRHGSRNERVIAVAYDTPVVGWQAKRVNTLRLWKAQPIDPILLEQFNAGDHIGALRGKQSRAEA